MIKREAVLHMPLSQYAFAESAQRLTLRLRAARGNLDACMLVYGDRALAGDAQENSTPMHIVATDALFAYYETEIVLAFDRVHYYFVLQSGVETLYYYADLFSDRLPGDTVPGGFILRTSEYYQYPVILRDELAQVPSWMEEAVIYQIFPDSFASGRRELTGKAGSLAPTDGQCSTARLGGTLGGIRENLDYIARLGCNCLYLNPVFAASAYHKYDTIDYFHIDPCLGTEADFDALVDAAHSRGIRIVLDGVFNHCGSGFFAFQDVLEKGEKSQYLHWFYDITPPVNYPQGEGEAPNYACFAYVGDMPKLNTSHPEVQAYFAEVGRYWVAERGVDGWRLDVANEISKDFWRAFRKAIRGANLECALIGEVWENSEAWLRSDLLDSTMNYDLRRHCRDFFADGTLDAAGFDARVTQMRMRYPAPYVRGQLNLLDSHDVPRFLSLCGGDIHKYRLALVFQMLCPGAPSLFYGDEQGIQGVEEQDYRAAMPWESRETVMEDFVRTLAALRKEPAIVRGAYHTIVADPDSRLYGFSRTLGEECITAYLNAGREPLPLCPPEHMQVIMSSGFQEGVLRGFGFIVLRKAESASV